MTYPELKATAILLGYKTGSFTKNCSFYKNNIIIDVYNEYTIRVYIEHHTIAFSSYKQLIQYMTNGKK